jgi:AsmA protein
MHFTQVKSEISNQQGLLTIHQMQEPGRWTTRSRLARRAGRNAACLFPQLDNVEIGSILKAFNYSINLTGKLADRRVLRR